MASIEFIQKRVDGAKTKIEKLNKKLERIEIAKASNYEENNPYCYSDYDLRYTVRDLEEAKANLQKYENQLAKEQEKAGSRNVKAINDFLDKWLQNCIEYFDSEYPKYQAAREEYFQKDREYCQRFNNRSNQTPEERKADRKEHDKMKRDFRAAWAHVTQFDHGSLPWRETMVKDLTQERIRKYDDIIERTNEIVGKITDASKLRVSQKGNLDGIVIGEKGTAKVQTIGAGGYNIQCFHFRTLINPM